MPGVISNDGELSQKWPGVDKPVTVVSDGSDAEGFCPTGDLGCPGLQRGANGKLICGLIENADCPEQVAACNSRRQEAR